MKKLLCTLLLAVAAIHFSRAEDAPAGKDAAAVVAPNPPTIEAKNKSSFVMDESGRNPFWPIGWKPAVKVSAGTGDHTAGPEIRATAFLVSSITMDDGTRYAIINGKVMNEGTMFGLQMGNQTYQITVKSIQDGQVILQRRDQEIPVPLRRK